MFTRSFTPTKSLNGWVSFYLWMRLWYGCHWDGMNSSFRYSMLHLVSSELKVGWWEQRLRAVESEMNRNRVCMCECETSLMCSLSGFPLNRGLQNQTLSIMAAAQKQRQRLILGVVENISWMSMKKLLLSKRYWTYFDTINICNFVLYMYYF